jgi:hypothetical protein
MEYGVVVFYSTSWALKAEKVAKEGGFEVKLIPTPRQISSDCGTALRFRWEDREALLALLESKGVRIEGVHKI